MSEFSLYPGTSTRPFASSTGVHPSGQPGSAGSKYAIVPNATGSVVSASSLQSGSCVKGSPDGVAPATPSTG